ncbi:MAG: hypothetical protein ACP5EQ_02640 [Candidatus Cloacimonadia bacterium]
METSAKIIIDDSRLIKEVKDEEIDLNGKYIGLQIKPITYEQTPEVYRWKEWLSKTHNKFEKDNRSYSSRNRRSNGRNSSYSESIRRLADSSFSQ